MRPSWPKVALLLLPLAFSRFVVAATDPPSVVITYEGELAEFPRYMSGARYVVEIPKTNHSKLIRGDFSTCGTRGSSTIWSFPNAEGTQAILRNSPGRIEIFFADGPLIAQVTAPATSSVPEASAPASPDLRLSLSQPILDVGSGSIVSSKELVPTEGLSPIASGPMTTGGLGDRSISMASFTLDVPDSPAFAVLGISPENVVRPSNPQELVTSVLNGVDRNGNFQTGLALDTAPYLLFFGKDVTLASYQQSYITRLLTRTQLSFATSKGTEQEDPSTRLALGLHLTLLDRGDPRFDVDLQQTYDSIDAEIRRIRGPIPPGADMQLEADRREEAMRPLFKAAFAEARRRNWNRTNWSLGAAPSWIDPQGEGEDFLWNGATVWTSLAYGFEGIPVLEKSSQLILHARYRDHEEVPDPLNEAKFIRQNSVLLGARLRIGTVDTNASIDAGWIREWGSGRENRVGRVAVGLERRMTKNLWLSVTAGKEFGNEEKKDALTILANFKLGFGDDPAPVTSVPSSAIPVVLREVSDVVAPRPVDADSAARAGEVVPDAEVAPPNLSLTSTAADADRRRAIMARIRQQDVPAPGDRRGDRNQNVPAPSGPLNLGAGATPAPSRTNPNRNQNVPRPSGALDLTATPAPSATNPNRNRNVPRPSGALNLAATPAPSRANPNRNQNVPRPGGALDLTATPAPAKRTLFKERNQNVPKPERALNLNSSQSPE